MSRKRSQPELLAASIIQLDPVDCGSTVGYKIVKGRDLWAEVDLSDCNRKIQWSFYSRNAEAGIVKIDKAIEILTKFRTDWAAAVETRVSRQRRKQGV